MQAGRGIAHNWTEFLKSIAFDGSGHHEAKKGVIGTKMVHFVRGDAAGRIMQGV